MKDKIGLILIGGIFVFGVLIAYSILKPEDKLPVFQPSDINPALVDAEIRNRTDHRVADFELINQHGDTVTGVDAEGKIRIVDFFFTRCTTICPVMNENMAKVQEQFADDNDILLMSHSVTPDMDSVPELAAYAERFGAIPGRWWLLTGPKSHIYDLARKSYFAVLDEGDGGLQDFIHTENVILVDKQGRLRGYYDGTSAKEMGVLVKDVARLRKEYEGY